MLIKENKRCWVYLLGISIVILKFLEVEGKICSLDPEFSTSGNLRKAVHRLNRDYNSKIYKEECSCDFKAKGKLNMDGTPRKHYAYIKDWAL
jgi:hypothetical protein